ncbi:PREDICTED: uncharacterized protein LOC109581449 isoform X2 [Amphimedon queenslandica]|uniref:Fibronectin type-III domain-containing protein n=1 Tax=Amphimedon queenslandica TaxID=400682 RepID=A0AAN0J312_AMPQE|nr:PREDICTED: uncharacterized protein LOC109581449 isoform X2 [Amphimedon queenslandica]|eukprot:XP_019851111.1 PREDICTED: uncharacterized protein LOC109581449 isoform X2 [Amphimedon queenslandica]
MMMAFVSAVIILCQICFSGASISFIIVPVTQYVYVNDTVIFECAINVTHYHPSFETYPSVDGSVLSSGGMASLSLTATSEVNGTEVTCEAPNGARTEPAYLYVQGPPDSVSSLTVYQLDSCCMFISWYPPFTLPRLTVKYIISVGTDQQYLNDSITNYTYCPMNPTNKQYLFNITTTNKAGNGSTSNITVGFESTNVQLYVTDKERGNVNWTFHFIVSVHQFCTNVPPLMNITLKGCTKDNCYSTTNVSISNSSYNNISLVVQFPSNKTLNTNATLYYQNGVTVQSNTITISTHDLNLTLINVTSNSVCVQFQFVNGSTLYIDYIHIIDSQGQFHWDDLKHLNDSLNFIKCFDGIPAGNNLTLYACEWATIWICISNSPAVITGINITNDSTSSVLMSSVHSSSVSLTSTVLTTPSMMSVSSIISTSPVVTTSSVPTTSSSNSITSSMTSLPTKIHTLVVPTPSIMSEFETYPSSVQTISTT